jgi:hypothetical protein
MTSLFPPRESLVVTSRRGRETRGPFFYGARDSQPRENPCDMRQCVLPVYNKIERAYTSQLYHSGSKNGLTKPLYRF